MKGLRANILIVDDDREMAELLADILQEAGYSASTANSGSEALGRVEQARPDVLISDLHMSGMNGHVLQGELKRLEPDLPVVIITAFGSIQSAVESMKLGAFDYITKPFNHDELLLVVSRAVENRQLRQEIKRLRGELARTYGLTNIIAANPRMSAILDRLEQVADSNATVLITGESGTGKDLLARALHFESSRRQQPFVPVNCAAIPDNLIESELFGHLRGAFTDARQNRVGLFESASGGTLFLDEIGEMPLSLQAKLLRVIETKKIRPVGANEEISVDVRIVAATNIDLQVAIAGGRFRSDLFFRIAMFELHVPPLRERPEDIPLLIKSFLQRASREAGKPIPDIEPEATQMLLRYRWPGNVRELQNAVHAAVILALDNKVQINDLPPKVIGAEKQAPPTYVASGETVHQPTLDEFELEYIRQVLASVGGNKTEAAAILKIDRRTLHRRLEESARLSNPK
jgi:DNA-binding NtrC family response regulator